MDINFYVKLNQYSFFFYSEALRTATKQNQIPCYLANCTKKAGDTSRGISIFIALDLFPRNLA